MEFKVGDKVIPRKPKDDTDWPVWYSGMDCSEGKELIIERVFGKKGEAYKIGDWWYSEEWLSLCDEEPFEGNV